MLQLTHRCLTLLLYSARFRNRKIRMDRVKFERGIYTPLVWIVRFRIRVKLVPDGTLEEVGTENILLTVYPI